MSSLRAQLAALNQQYREMNAIYHDMALRLGLSDSVLSILYALSDGERTVTQNELCIELYLPKQTVNSAVGNLVRQGYIRLESLPGARNRKALRLTPAGLALTREKIAPVYAAECRALNRMSGDEFQVFLALIRRYLGYLREETAQAAAAGETP